MHVYKCDGAVLLLAAVATAARSFAGTCRSRVPKPVSFADAVVRVKWVYYRIWIRDVFWSGPHSADGCCDPIAKHIADSDAAQFVISDL